MTRKCISVGCLERMLFCENRPHTLLPSGCGAVLWYQTWTVQRLPEAPLNAFSRISWAAPFRNSVPKTARKGWLALPVMYYYYYYYCHYSTLQTNFTLMCCIGFCVHCILFCLWESHCTVFLNKWFALHCQEDLLQRTFQCWRLVDNKVIATFAFCLWQHLLLQYSCLTSCYFTLNPKPKLWHSSGFIHQTTNTYALSCHPFCPPAYR